MSGDGGEGNSDISQQNQQMADAGQTYTPAQAQEIDAAHFPGQPAQQTDFFGQNYNPATAINPALAALGTVAGASGSFDAGAGSDPLGAVLPPNSTLDSGAAPSWSANIQSTGDPSFSGAASFDESGFLGLNSASTSPSASGSLDATPGTNVITGSSQGSAPASAPGLPGVSASGDLSATNQQQNNSTTPAGNKSLADSLGIKSGLGAAIGAAGLGYAAVANKAPAYTPQLKAQADALSAQGQQLLSYLQSGTLPAGLKASLDQATAAAKAKIISNFAGQGLNTDPNQNSALQAELAAVDQQALISTAQIGQQLMTSGIQEAGVSSQLYTTLAGIDQTQTANIGKAIANFASSLGGGGGSGAPGSFTYTPK